MQIKLDKQEVVKMVTKYFSDTYLQTNQQEIKDVKFTTYGNEMEIEVGDKEVEKDV